MTVVWGVVIGAGVIALACLVMVTALGRSGRTAARRSDALWGGLAQLDVGETPTLPQAAAAVTGLDRRSGRRGTTRSVGGVLVVTREELRWEPRLWLGRGRARGFSLPVRAVRAWDLYRPAGALVGHELRVAVADGGEVRLQVVDADGVRAALEHACGWGG